MSNSPISGSLPTFRSVKSIMLVYLLIISPCPNHILMNVTECICNILYTTGLFVIIVFHVHVRLHNRHGLRLQIMVCVIHTTARCALPHFSFFFSPSSLITGWEYAKFLKSFNRCWMLRLDVEGRAEHLLERKSFGNDVFWGICWLYS